MTYAGLTLGILRGFDLILTWLEALSHLSENLSFQIRNLEFAALGPLRGVLTRDTAPRSLPLHPATYAGFTHGILRGFDLILTWWEAISPLSDYFGFQIRFLKFAAQRPLGPALTRGMAPRPPPCTPCDLRRLDPRDFEGV